MAVYVSDDGKEFIEVASQVYEPAASDVEDCIYDVVLEFPETSARYIKVRAKSFAQLPQWHYDYGKVPSLLIDEVIVK
jgi:hexosaminidase